VPTHGGPPSPPADAAGVRITVPRAHRPPPTDRGPVLRLPHTFTRTAQRTQDPRLL